jgi:maltose-binding protein MalE
VREILQRRSGHAVRIAWVVSFVAIQFEIVKQFFSGTALLLLALSFLAWKLTPRAQENGKTFLTWVSDDNPMRRAQIEPFNHTHPQYELKLDPTNAGMEKVIVQSLGGVGPDLFDCYDPFQLSAYVKAGIAWDVTDELTKLGIDVKSETWQAVHPDCIVDGRIYGFPTNAAANGVWFHKDVLAEAGVRAPSGAWKWDELLELAKKLTVRDANGRVQRYGFLCDWDQNWLQFVMQAAGKFYSEDGSKCVVNSPEAAEAMRFLNDLIHKHRVSPNPAEEMAMATQGGWGSGTITLFAGKRGAMAMGGRWWLCTLRDYKNLRLSAMEAPHQHRRVFRGYGKATLINAASPRRYDALNFFKYQASRTYNELINAQADGLGPVIRFTETRTFLRNPQFPEEDYNAVWREMQRVAVPDQVSPFVNGPTVNRIVVKQLDLMRGGDKSVEDGLATIERQVNEHIAEMLKQDPTLKSRYDALTRGGN